MLARLLLVFALYRFDIVCNFQAKVASLLSLVIYEILEGNFGRMWPRWVAQILPFTGNCVDFGCRLRGTVVVQDLIGLIIQIDIAQLFKAITATIISLLIIPTRSLSAGAALQASRLRRDPRLLRLLIPAPAFNLH